MSGHSATGLRSSLNPRSEDYATNRAAMQTLLDELNARQAQALSLIHIWPLVAAAITLGGNVRVGLEDNLYLAPGQLARSNGELVAKAAELVRLVGGEVATVAEAREMLQLLR